MKVRCIDNTSKNLHSDFYRLAHWSKLSDNIGLTVGNIYIVYAIFYIYNHRCFLVCNDIYDGEYYTNPMFYPDSLFEVIDETPSKYWIKRRIIINEEDNMQDVGFPDIIDDQYFLGGTVEGYKEEVETFQKWKKLIDKE